MGVVAVAGVPVAGYDRTALPAFFFSWFTSTRRSSTHEYDVMDAIIIIALFVFCFDSGSFSAFMAPLVRFHDV